MYVGWINAAVKSLQLMFSKKPEWVEARRELKEGEQYYKQGIKKEICEPFKAGLKGKPYEKPEGWVGPVGGLMQQGAKIIIFCIIVVVLGAVAIDQLDHTDRVGPDPNDKSMPFCSDKANWTQPICRGELNPNYNKKCDCIYDGNTGCFDVTTKKLSRGWAIEHGQEWQLNLPSNR